MLEVLLYRNYSAQWYLISSLTEPLKLLPLVTLDSKESSIKIVYPEYNTMKKTSVFTVCCVNTGKVINTRRKCWKQYRNQPRTCLEAHLMWQTSVYSSRLEVSSLVFRSFRFTMMGRHNLFFYGNVFFVFRCFKRSLNKENCIINEWILSDWAIPRLGGGGGRGSRDGETNKPAL